MSAGSFASSGGGSSAVSVFLTVIVLAVLGFFAIAVADHMAETRAGATESRMDVWTRLNIRNKNRDNDSEYFGASCMLAKVRGLNSIRSYGEPNPHFKLAICKNGLCDYAVIGVLYEEPMVVTARVISIADYKKQVIKDGCIEIGFNKAYDILASGVPIQ